jgi:molecular chaperone HscB
VADVYCRSCQHLSPMNYFEFFGIPVSFLPDEADLKKRFLQNSKKYHPDFFTLDSVEKQSEILELSTLNNQAYRTLSDFDLRMKYILELKEVLKEEGKNDIPQDFLMEMMEINEALMELEFEFNEKIFQEAKDKVQSIESQLLQAIRPTLAAYVENKTSSLELELVKDFYLKKRYILRIQENLDRFAPALKEA